jgi:hypothetical protein
MITGMMMINGEFWMCGPKKPKSESELNLNIYKYKLEN